LNRLREECTGNSADHGELNMSPSEGDFDDDALWNFVPRNVQHLEQNPIPLSPHQEGDAASQNQAPESRQQPWKRSREIDAAPHSAAQQTMQAPWKRSKECRPFGSDDAIVDLRNKALASNRLSEPPAPPVGMKRRIAVRLAAIPVILATGIVGYELGSGPQAPLPQSAPRFSQFDQSGLVSEELVPTAQVLKSALLSSASPALLSRVSSEQLRTDVTKPQRPDDSAKLTVSVMVGNNAPMNFGVELMTYGDVTKARILFQRVAEAGDGAGAFALAETYDPIVLRELRLPRGTMPDLVLARTWYERARDLGSLEARDRISRLALLPH
jgi:hypothetical protein